MSAAAPRRAAVFDLDGTLADNMHLHARAFQAFAERHGLPPITEGTRRRIDGKRNAEIMPILFERDLAPAEIATLAAMGHRVGVAPGNLGSRIQLIRRDPATGVLFGGSDPRAEGMAAGY